MPIRYLKTFDDHLLLSLETRAQWQAFARHVPQRFEWRGTHVVKVPPIWAPILLSALAQDGQALEEVQL